MDDGNSFNPLKNVVLNLRATGLAAIVCVYLICITVFAIFAPDNSNAHSVGMALLFFGSALSASITFAKLK